MKRVLDLVISLCCFIVFSPIFLIISLIIKLTSEGPIFFKQKRIGINNSEFNIFKFRTMRIDTPNIATHLLENPDKYITKIGKILRKTSLDELPQLINIIKGEMSIVGPRPALYNQIDLKNMRTEKGIHKIVPGLTGWAQINGRDEIALSEKVELDEYYLKNKKLSFDLKIIIMTFLSVIRSDGVKEGKKNEVVGENMKKKMLQVANIDFTVEKLLKKIIKESKNEYEVHVCCVKGKYSEKLEKEDIEFRYVNFDRKIRPISNFKTVVQLYKIMKKEKYDIVHVHTPIMSVLARIAAKLAKVKVVVYTAHGFYFHERMKKWVFNLCVGIEKFMGRYFTDYIFTQSYEDYKFALENKFKEKEKVLCISNGINLNIYNKNAVNKSKKEIKEELEIPLNSKIICFTGRLVKEKGILDLLEGFKNTIKKEKDIYLLVIGDNVTGDRDSTFKNKIDELLEDDNLKNKIRLLGLRNDVPDILSVSDVFCLPSYREGMPRSIIEAMAMENAIIATNIRGCREEVVDNKNGFLVNVNSPKEIEVKIKEIFSDHIKLEKMKKYSLERARKLYDEEKVVATQLEMFRKII